METQVQRTTARGPVTKRLSWRHGLAALATLGVTVMGTGVGSASALWNDCPDTQQYNCFFADSEGHGRMWKFKQDNTDITVWAVNTESGWNRKYPYRACGYPGVGFSGAPNYGRPYNDKENYSARTIRSNRFVNGVCSL